jgi:hypothetical protein
MAALIPDALARWVEADFDRHGTLFVGGLR